MIWSVLTNWVMGVPYDMITRARRQGGQPQQDFEDMVRVNVNRIFHLIGWSAYLATGFFCFVLTGLGLLGFFYGFEFAQAVFMLALPTSIVLLMTVKKAKKLHAGSFTGDDLRKQIVGLRFWIQVIGVIALFITSTWGMWYNMNHNTAWY
ncbi:component of SufBCD complex [Parasulfitobacter algicola]|uniref:Component of SufBCD complex n=1 Tax=Parasulfitobacter algicola TaxID=2614809 RepID=A0ABX2IQV0_9RHOB|nr:component of SufBCD complex [Sulfitobacter algicola]NSX55248.1 component of SufBCD complex [Sulfitobacter algicola]